jgi:hypothetical protein
MTMCLNTWIIRASRLVGIWHIKAMVAVDGRCFCTTLYRHLEYMYSF